MSEESQRETGKESFKKKKEDHCAIVEVHRCENRARSSKLEKNKKVLALEM